MMKPCSRSEKMWTLSAIWESYAQLIRWKNDRNPELRLQQQRLVLDKFLGHFISLALENKGEIYIGEMRNIGSELSQEFMRNVDAVTRNLSEEDATRSLENYMLHGRGWRLLFTVDRVGLRGVSQRHDLCEVLLNLLPYCLHMKPCSPVEEVHLEIGAAGMLDSFMEKQRDVLNALYNTSQPLSSCFYLVNKSSRLKQLGCPSLHARKMRRVESTTTPLKKKEKKRGLNSRHGKSKQKRTRNTPSKRILLNSKSESEEEGSVSESGTLRGDDRRSKQPRFKRGIRGHMWSPFTKDEDSETDDDYIGSLVDIEDSPISITAYHLIRIILKLLLALGEFDMNQNVRGRTLSSTILPHLLFFISQFKQETAKIEEISGISKAEKWVDSHHQEREGDYLDRSHQTKVSHPDSVKVSNKLAPKLSTHLQDANRDSEDEVEVVPWQGLLRIALLKQVVRVVLTLSGIVATQQNGVRILINLKVANTLLDVSILDSLIPRVRGGTAVNSDSKSTVEVSKVEAGVALDMMCGLMQLLQAVYTNLPFNPSCIIDANYLATNLTKPEIMTRINRLIEFSELRAHQGEKTASSSEIFEQDLISSLDSFKQSSNLGGEKEIGNNPSLQTHEDSEAENNSQEERKSEAIEISTSDPVILSKKLVTGTHIGSQNFPHYCGNQQKCDSGQPSKTGHETDAHEEPSLNSRTSPTEVGVSISATKLPSYSLLAVPDVTADPVRCIGSLITTLKTFKVNYIHAMKCLKHRHRNCEYGKYYDHHHDILGVPHYTTVKAGQTTNFDPDYDQSQSASHSRFAPSPSKKSTLDPQTAPLRCIVSELATVLLDYISEAQFKASRIHLMSTLRSVGVCCCLQPERIISSIVPHLPIFSQAVRSYALDTVTSILLDHFQGAQENQEVLRLGSPSYSKLGENMKEVGGAELSGLSQDSSRCVHCYLEGSSPLLAGLPMAMDSGFSSCDIEEMRRQKLLERWKSLRLLRKIIIAKDDNLALTCAKHLIILAIRGNSEIKEELFFGVYLNVLHMDVRMVRQYPDFSRQSSVGPILERPSSSLAQSKGEIMNSGKNLTRLSDSQSVIDPSLLNSQESLNDSLILSSSLTPTEISSADDSAMDNSVPSSIMLLCVSALPYVLQVDKVMSIFLARGGLAKLTKLLDHEQLRAPVMSVFEALIMIDEQRLRGRTSGRKSVYEGGGVIQTFIDTLAKRTCTVTATLQQISLQNSKDNKSVWKGPNLLSESDDIRGLKQTSDDFESDFLSAFAEPSQDWESHAEMKVAGVSEERTTSEVAVISPYSCMAETLPVLLDMWKTCAKLCMNSRMFRAYYRESPCLYVVQETLVLALSLLGELSEPRKCSVEGIENNSLLTATINNSRSMNMEKRKHCHSFIRERTASIDSLDDAANETMVPFSHEAKLEFIEAVMMVCFSCHTIAPSQKRGHEDELWLRLNSALQSCIHLEPSKLSAVFQMLLNVALPCCPSILEYSYSQIVLMLNLREREDVADEDEVRQLLQQGLEEDGDTIFTEYGYEGDSECSVCFDWKRGLECSLENQALSSSGANTRPCVPAAFRLFVELMIACHKIASRGVILHTVALRLLQTLRSSKRAVKAFCTENLLEVLIEGFTEVLVHSPENGKQSTLQEIILSLIQVVAQSEICASELKQFLRLFQDNTETSNSLLSTLLAVIEKSNVSPNATVTFPVKTHKTGPLVSSSDELDESQDIPLDVSVWSHSAVEIDVTGIPWPPSPKGFSLAMWMCTELDQSGRQGGNENSGKERGGKTHSDSEDFEKRTSLGNRLPLSDCLLLFAIGNKEKMFEVWLHVKTASLYCRLTSGKEEVKVLKEQVFEHLLTHNIWQLLVITYSEILDGSTFVGKLNIVVDGWQKESSVFDHPAFFSRRQPPHPCLYSGDAYNVLTKPNIGTWKLGTLRIFRDIGLSDDWWFHLYCLGPNCAGISKCDCGELRACYTPAMLKHMASVTHLNLDILLGGSQLPDFDAARAAQVIVYDVNEPEWYTAYVIPHSPAASVHDDLGLVPPSGSSSDLLTQKPIVRSTKLRGRVKVRSINTLEKAVEQAGGVEAFLFLVAKIFEDSMKVVDRGGSLEMAEHLQSKATHILFQLVHQFPSLAQAFIDANGFAMLSKVLTSSKSIVGYQMLKVLLDACTTESVFKVVPNYQHPVLRSHPEAVIRDVEILSQLLLQWRIWHKAGEEVTVMLFGALEALVSPKHHYRNFNLKQMQAGGVMNKIFSIYLERIQDGQPSLSVPVSQSAGKVIKSLLGSPPDLHLLMVIMDFLLLVHPAPSGFISFTPGSFYFKLWWDGAKLRASSFNQQKSRSISDKTEALDYRDSKSLSDKEQGKKDVLSGGKVVLTLSSSHHESYDEEEEKVFKFPPLKATNAGFEQSLDMDADLEESDQGWANRAQAQFPDGTLSYTNSSKHENTPDITSSYGDSAEEKVQESAYEKLPRSQETCENNGKDTESDGKSAVVAENIVENFEKKRGVSPRRKLLYSSIEVFDELKHTDSGEELTKASASSKETELQQVDSESYEEDVVDGKSPALEGQPDVMTSDQEDNDEGLMMLCVSLIEFLTQMIKEFPEASLDNVFSKVISPKSMLVLARNPCNDMRLAVMKLLSAYLSRAPTSLIDAFIKMDGFYLLANQLHSYPVTAKHIEAAVSIMLRQDFKFNENFMLGELGELSPVQQAAPILLLSLLDGTTCDTDLCRKTLILLSQFLESTSTMSTMLLDLGLAETMCNLATSIQRRPISEPGPEDDELTKSLLVEVQHILCITAVKEFSWSGPSHFQNVEDMFTLLKALEDHEFNRGSNPGKKRAETARAFQISLVVKILEYVEKRSEELTRASHGWFTASVVTSSSSTKSHPVERVKSFHNYTTPSSTPPSPSGRPYLKPEILTQPLHHQRDVSNAIIRRSPFSSPDIMGCLSDPPADERPFMSSQLDSDSSGSGRLPYSPRLEGGSDTRPSLLGSFFSRKRKMIYVSVSQSDLLDRFRKILVAASDLAVMFPREDQLRPLEQRPLNFFSEAKTISLDDRYLKHLFMTVYKFYEHCLNKDLTIKKNRNPIMHGAKDVLKTQFARLLLLLMSQKVDFDMRAYTLAFITTQQKGIDAVKSIITDKQMGTELCFYLYNLLALWKDWLNTAQRENGFTLMQVLRRAGFTIVSPDQMLTQAQVNALMEDKKQTDAKYRKELVSWLQRREFGTSRITQKFESVRLRVTDQAMKVTQNLTHLQIEERKKLVIHIKNAMTKQIQLKKQWQELVQTLSHERGMWYQKSSYPQSWQLDPTEGPGRVRKRLQRCHLGIEDRFLLPGHKQKLDAEKVDPPLIFLFEDDHQMSDSAALIYKLYTNEKIQHTCKCTVVSPASESKGELLIGEVYIYFVADGAITVANYTQMLLGNLDHLSITWPHTDIRELHKRWYQLQDVGLEIFLISGRTCFLAFQSTHDRDELYNILRSTLELPNLVAGETLQGVQQAWREGEVTNYDYLMHLNKLAGRSYTDLMQNLMKPIAVQEKSREKRYKDNYEFLCQEANRPYSEDEMVRVAPFHYGSHYSNSGTVLHYMVRLPPFTQMFLSYQDSNFDIPDRTFHSINTSWRLSSFESSTDVKELIPEFFFLPEFFLNTEGFNFGQRQNGESVNHVTLPLWCGGNPRLFTFIHRQALESSFVTANLHHWLDLVFGYKQQGPEAVRAINVFHPATYFGIDASGIKDSVKRQALLTMIRTYGQTPKQLFRNPHPSVHARQSGSSAEEKQKTHVRKPVPYVIGLKWGNYVGSPDLNPPVSYELANVESRSITRLVALSTGLVFGVERNANILLLHGKQRDVSVKSTEVMWAGVITWGYHDRIIRIRSYRDKPLINFLPHHSCGEITCVESVPDCRLLFTAGTAGNISVYTMTHNSSKPSNLQVRGVKKTLYGHSGPINTLFVCQEFSILVSGSSDGTCIIWDLNRLSYIRSITSHCAPITTLTVSSTLGDIASVSRQDSRSCSLQLHTVNASHVATQEVPEIINCLAYSYAPEGRSVNVIAGGLQSGAVRLWSSWDLTPLRDLMKEAPTLYPIVSLTFSSDSQYMVIAAMDGSITLWDKDVRSLRNHADKFIPVISYRD